MAETHRQIEHIPARLHATSLQPSRAQYDRIETLNLLASQYGCVEALRAYRKPNAA
jgi:hypothetical protein